MHAIALLMLPNMAKVWQFEARVICKYLHNLLIPGSLPTALPCLFNFLKKLNISEVWPEFFCCWVPWCWLDRGSATGGLGLSGTLWFWGYWKHGKHCTKCSQIQKRCLVQGISLAYISYPQLSVCKQQFPQTLLFVKCWLAPLRFIYTTSMEEGSLYMG